MRFAVLHHTGWPGRSNHYDLMIQFAAGNSDDDTVLKTFATCADAFPEAPAALNKIADHRRAYLTLEGPISGGRGHVARIDEGEVRFIQAPDAEWRDVRVELSGLRLQGAFQLKCLLNDDYLLERV